MPRAGSRWPGRACTASASSSQVSAVVACCRDGHRQSHARPRPRTRLGRARSPGAGVEPSDRSAGPQRVVRSTCPARRRPARPLAPRASPVRTVHQRHADHRVVAGVAEQLQPGRLVSTTMPSCTCAIASAEPARISCSCLRYSRAGLSVPLSARLSRDRRGVRASRRLQPAEVRERHHVLGATASSPRRSVPRPCGSRTRITGTSGAKRARKSMASGHATIPFVRRRQPASRGASWVSASPRSLASATSVSAPGWPALRRVLLMVSTWS